MKTNCVKIHRYKTKKLNLNEIVRFSVNRNLNFYSLDERVLK